MESFFPWRHAIKALPAKPISQLSLATLLIALAAAPPAARAADDKYTVDSGNQASTLKNQGGQQNAKESKSGPKNDDSHDRSETDAGHGRSDQSTGSKGDVLIDQSTYKNRDKPVYIPPITK